MNPIAAVLIGHLIGDWIRLIDWDQGKQGTLRPASRRVA